MSPFHTVLAVLATVLWGFTFVAIKVGLGEFPPLLFAALRFLVVAIPAMVFVPRQGIPWRWIIAVGLAMGTFQYALLYIGMARGMPTGTVLSHYSVPGVVYPAALYLDFAGCAPTAAVAGGWGWP